MNQKKKNAKPEPLRTAQKVESSPSILQKSPAWVALGLNIILFGILALAYTMRFQTNDDVGMMLEVAGKVIAAEPTEYVLFTNVVLAFLLKTLYQIAPNMAWYGFYMSFSLLLANWGILYVMLKRSPTWFSILLFLVYFWACAAFPAVSFQFTTVAGIVGVAGMAVLLFGNPEHSENIFELKNLLKPHILAGLALLFLSSSIRFSAFGLAVLMYAPLLLFYFIESKKLFFQKTILFGLGVAIAAPAFLINHLAYQREDWKEASEFSAVIGRFVDDAVVQKAPPEAQKKAFEKAGWSMTDFQMTVFWFFLDDKTYSLEKCKAALAELDVFDRRVRDKEYETWQTNIAAELPPAKSLMWFCLFVGALACVFLPKKDILKVVVSALAIPVVLFVIFYFLRPPPVRVFHQLFIHLAVLPLVMIQMTDYQNFMQDSGLRKVLVVVALLASLYGVAGNLGFMKEVSQNAKNGSQQLKSIVGAINPNPNNLYVVWANSFPYELISPYEKTDFLKNLQLFSLGSIQRTPIAKQVLAKFSITDLYQALAEKPNVYLLVRNDYLQMWLGLLGQYMQEHYKRPINAQKTGDVGSFSIVKISWQQ